MSRISVVPLLVILATPLALGQAPPPPQEAPKLENEYVVRPVFLSGKVVIDSGGMLPERARIERVCNGKVRREGYTDAQGSFRIQLGRELGVAQDADSSSFDETVGNLNPDLFGRRAAPPLRQGVTERELVNCELRAVLAGFRSDSISLAGRKYMDDTQVGTIVLHRLGKVEGTVVSVASLQAPGKAKKAFKRGRKAAANQKWSEAQQEFEKAVTLYPKYAEAWLELGSLFLRQQRDQQGQKALEQALAADEKFLPPYFHLAVLAAQHRDWQRAAELTDKALALDASNYPAAYFYNSLAYYNLQKLEQAENSARLGRQLDSQYRIPRIDLVLASIRLQRQDYAGAADKFQSFLSHVPAGADADLARAKLTETKSKLAGTPAGTSPTAVPLAEPPGSSEARQSFALKGDNFGTASPAEGAAAWAPPDVDEAVPVVSSDVSCPLPLVLQGAAARVKQFVSDLAQFTATERLEHQELNKSGTWGGPEIRVFKYLVEVRQGQAGMLAVEETRDGSGSLLVFPAAFADLGLPALTLVFHPYFLGDHSITCEGLGQWRGQAAWQLHFQQRRDRPARMLGYKVGDHYFSLRLKGRAWISAKDHQVLHVETDLTDAVSEIRLLRDHIAVDYRPVRFPDREVELWLPEAAEAYVDVRGRRYRRTHRFTDFLLFAVDANQRIVEPKEP